MVKVMIIDKCLLCEKEFIINKEDVKNNKLNIQFNLIYCHKCIKNARRIHNK